MPFPRFDRSRLILEPLSSRRHDLTVADILSLEAPIPPVDDPKLKVIADRIRAARERESAVILMMGAHVLRRGNSRFIIDLMERGMLTHVAMNGAGAIHDFEFAHIGATTESVPRYIKTGQFGMWRETGVLNEIATEFRGGEQGLGEAVGQAIQRGWWKGGSDDAREDKYPFRDISVMVAGVRLSVPVTIHVSVGQDIIHQHPNCDAAALGELSYIDFLVFAESVRNLEGGVLLNFGSAVMGPEIYLKALSMARNVARQEGKRIADFTTAVFDLPELGEDFEAEPPKTDPRYYYRPWKTILVRTVADGGEGLYVSGDHRDTFPALWKLLTE